MELDIRLAEQKDLNLIFQYIKKLAVYENAPDAVIATEESLEEWLFHKNKGEVYFLMLDNKEIGFAFLYETFPAYIGKGGLYIDDLFIDQEYRNKGYGKVFLKQLIKIALERGCGRMEWCCLNWNKSSLAFYEKIGANILKECSILRLSEEAMRKFVLS